MKKKRNGDLQKIISQQKLKVFNALKGSPLVWPTRLQKKA